MPEEVPPREPVAAFAIDRNLMVMLGAVALLVVICLLPVNGLDRRSL
jgi:hypothetical protein